MPSRCFLVFLSRIILVCILLCSVGCRQDKVWVSVYYERESNCLDLCRDGQYAEARNCLLNLRKYVQDGLKVERDGLRLDMALATIYTRLYLIDMELDGKTEDQWYFHGEKMFILAQQKDGLHSGATYVDFIKMITHIDRKNRIQWSKTNRTPQSPEANQGH